MLKTASVRTTAGIAPSVICPVVYLQSVTGIVPVTNSKGLLTMLFNRRLNPAQLSVCYANARLAYGLVEVERAVTALRYALSKTAMLDSTILSICREAAKACTKLKDRAQKAGVRLHRQLRQIDTALWQLHRLIHETPEATNETLIRQLVRDMDNLLLDLEDLRREAEGSTDRTGWPPSVFLGLILTFVLFALSALGFYGADNYGYGDPTWVSEDFCAVVAIITVVLAFLSTVYTGLALVEYYVPRTSESTKDVNATTTSDGDD